MEWEEMSALLKSQESSGECMVEVAVAHQVYCLQHSCMMLGVREDSQNTLSA